LRRFRGSVNGSISANQRSVCGSMTIGAGDVGAKMMGQLALESSLTAIIYCNTVKKYRIIR
jgi:hypothetical protein